MNLRTYQAFTMAEALAAVKRDLGADVVILNTRSFKRGGLLGLGRKTIIEVTATTAQHAPGQSMAVSAACSVKPKDKALAATRAYAGSAKRVGASSVNQATLPAEGPNELDLLKTQRLAQALLEQHERRKRESLAELTTGDQLAAPEASTSGPATGVSAQRASSRGAERQPVPRSPVAKRFVLTSPEQMQTVNRRRATTPTASPAPRRIPPVPREDQEISQPAAEPPGGPVRLLNEPDRRPSGDGVAGKLDGETSQMHDELAAIRTMVGQVLQRQTTTAGEPIPTMPQALFDMYLKLIGQEVSEELADRIINDVRDELTPSSLNDQQALRDAVCRRLADYIPVADKPLPSRSEDGRPLTIALVGPTGVGKTTTLAKLAASFKLRHGRSVGLITADTYRIAAVDQLRTYANIIGVPLKIALTPSEMRQAMHQLRDCDVILIDTAGRSQNDAERIDELKAIIDAADPHETHLVLSSTAGEKVLLREAEAFSGVGVDKIVLTKLDEAVSFGMLINVVRQLGKQLSFFTTGQEVPDHIEISRAQRLAELVVGGELRQ